MDWPHPRLIAHRGGGVLAPENTLAGLRMAAHQGYRAVEFDVMLSADGVPVLIHDETLERTTNGRGRVDATPYRELARLDAGGWKEARFAGEPLPAFEAAAALCRSLGLWANVEIKPSAGREVETGRTVAEAACRHWQGSPPPLLSSFSPEALEAARAAAPGLPRGLLFDAPPAGWPDTLRRLDGFSLHCNHRHYSADLLAATRQAGVPLLLYTVNEAAAAAHFLRQGVAALFTDRIDCLQDDIA